MNDYKGLIGELKEQCSAMDYDCCSMAFRAADAIEQLVKERDAAVADLKSVLASECGLNQCRYCKYQEDDYQCHHDCIPYSEKWGWEWRGLEGKHE